jgi:Tol biopolymer transport system component
MCSAPKVSDPLDAPPVPAVRAELDRILAGDTFRRTERLSAFLKFIVERTLAGEGDSLKEQIIAVGLYGKEPDFNTAADPIVRVDARRLRDHLREFYAAHPGSAVVISLPKGSYTPNFSATPTTPDVGVVAVSPAGPPPWWRLAAGAALLAASLAVLVIAARSGRRPDSTRLLTVTSFPGNEEDPSLSPDGNFVAFGWTRNSDNPMSHIWIKEVDGDATRQLTNTPDVRDKWPAWSPDGRWIAFGRRTEGQSTVVVVSALGGPEQTVGTAVEVGPRWTPDSTALVFSVRVPGGGRGIVRHVLKTGEEALLTSAPAGLSDSRGEVSADGSRLLFLRGSEGRLAIFVKDLTSPEAIRVTEWYGGQPVGGLAWMPDGQEILYARPDVSGRQLVRRKIGDAAAVPIPGVPLEAVGPSLSNQRPDGTYRLAVAAGQANVGLRLIDLGSPLRNGSIATDSPFCEATRSDMPGRFSRDGNQVAFASDRGGSFQVWVANRDGSGLRSVTRLEKAFVNVGAWSPDGRSIAFDVATGEDRHVYVVRVDTGLVTKLTRGPSSEIDPEWSKDGGWIYFVSSQGGASAIWRVRSTGGEPARLTSEAGFEPRESPDGRTIYFVDRQRGSGPGAPATLRAVPVEGGPSKVIPAAVIPGAWDMTDSGILFLRRQADADDLALYDFGTGQVQRVATLAVRVSPAMSTRYLVASPDGGWAILSHMVHFERDILVLDHFR